MRRAAFGCSILLASVLVGALAPPAGAQYTPDEAWQVDVPLGDLTYHPRGAGASVGIAGPSTGLGVIWANGSATATVDLPAAATHLSFVASADRCEGGAHVEVRVDGKLLLAREVVANDVLPRWEDPWSDAGRWMPWARGTYAVRGEWAPGSHHLSFRFTNDLLTDTCDRNLKLSNIRMVGPDAGSVEPVTIDLRQWADPADAEVEPVSAGPVRVGMLWSPGTLRVRLDAYDADTLNLGVWRRCDAEVVVVRVDGEPLVPREHWFGRFSYADAFGRPGSWSDGPHVVEVELLDRPSPGCDGQVGIDHVRFAGTA